MLLWPSDFARSSSSNPRFFSRRRRHTRYWRDWSSDVCSSDLALVGHIVGVEPARDSAGQPIAVLKLALNKSIQPLPANSTDRKSVVEGKSVALGSRRGIVKKEMYVSC